MNRFAKVLERNGMYSLSKEIVEMMQKGWKCQGGTSAYTSRGNTYYVQLMIKETE